MPDSYAEDDYRDELFVPRDEIAGRVYTCLENSGLDFSRVLSLVAPPGAGKTWLMRSLKQWLQNQEHCVIWLDVSQVTNDDGQLLPERTRDWLQRVRRDAAELCADIVSVPLEGCEVPRCVQRMAERLCEVCSPERWPLVLVDGFDQFQTSSLRTFERNVLETLLHAGCIRIIICRRSDQRFGSPTLHYSQRRVNLDEAESDVFLASQQGARRGKRRMPPAFEMQFSRIRDTLFSTSRIGAANLFAAVQSYLPQYRWNHPFINAFLFKVILTQSKDDSIYRLTAQDLEQSCRELMNRPEHLLGRARRQPRTDDAGFALLKRMANELPERWPEASLRSKVGLSTDDLRFVAFLDSGSVIYCGEEGDGCLARFRVADGLRELLKDLYGMERIQ